MNKVDKLEFSSIPKASLFEIDKFTKKGGRFSLSACSTACAVAPLSGASFSDVV